MITVNKPLFKLGVVVATPAAIKAMENAEQSPWEFLSRHIVGDWGIVDDQDKAANDQAVQDGSRMLSVYLLNDADKTRLWIISEATDDRGNRSCSTLLLPSDY